MHWFKVCSLVVRWATMTDFREENAKIELLLVLNSQLTSCRKKGALQHQSRVKEANESLERNIQAQGFLKIGCSLVPYTTLQMALKINVEQTLNPCRFPPDIQI